MDESDVAAFREAASKLTEAQFLERFPNPVLLLFTATADGPVSFETALVESVEQLENLERASMRLERICPLTKSSANPYSGWISVGRTANCDVVIKSEAVSKLHAHFQRDDTDSWTVTDLASRNGVHVNGRRIPPKQRIAISDGDRLAFGPLSLQFVKPPRLWRMLRD